MNIHSSSRIVNLSSQIIKKSNSKRIQSTNQTNKIGLNDEIIERCREDLVNYYVCYGSAVVNVRNAERKKNEEESISSFFDLDECQSQDIIIDMATWVLLDSDFVKKFLRIEKD
jgi:hypothetical protein